MYKEKNFINFKGIEIFVVLLILVVYFPDPANKLRAAGDTQHQNICYPLRKSSFSAFSPRFNIICIMIAYPLA